MKRKSKNMTVDDLAVIIERTVAKKSDLANFATKDDLKGFATKNDLKGFAQQADVERLGVLMEQMDENVSLILEHTQSLRDLPPRVEKIEKDLEIVKNDVWAIKAGLPQKVDRSELDDLRLRNFHA